MVNKIFIIVLLVIFTWLLGVSVFGQDTDYAVYLPAISNSEAVKQVTVETTPPLVTVTATTTPSTSPTSTKTNTPTVTQTNTPIPSVTPTFIHTNTPTNTPTETSTALPNSEVIFIPSGSFQRGCDSTNDECYEFETPLHIVTLDAYYIDKYEVTNARYKACVLAGSCSPPLHNSSNTRPDYYVNVDYDNYPVIWINWRQAKAYCEWEGKRLPTEAEWERAARGDNDTRIFPWGNEAPNCTKANVRYYESGIDSPPIYCVGDTAQVGTYPGGASPYGVMDMAGNVSEWINDWFGSTYYCKGPEADTEMPYEVCGNDDLPYQSPWNNPLGPEGGWWANHMRRGGGWTDYERTVRVALRWDVRWSENYDRGFRCAKSP